jgi:PAS domain S-box-containing protein
VTARVADTPEELAARLDAGPYDLILSAYRLPGWTALDALALLRARGDDTPLIIVTGTLGDERAVDCVKQGAADYVIKDNLTRLPVAVGRALEERRLRRAQWASEERYRRLFESMPLPLWVFDVRTHADLAVNPAAVEHYGYSEAEFLALRTDDLRAPEDRPAREQYRQQLPPDVHASGTAWHRRRDGTVFLAELNGQPIPWGRTRGRDGRRDPHRRPPLGHPVAFVTGVLSRKTALAPAAAHPCRKNARWCRKNTLL